MRICRTFSEEKLRVFFDDVESNNIKKAFKGNISIRNINLCYFIEKTLPKFEECKGKRVMVLNIKNDESVNALVLVQDVDEQFAIPKEKSYWFKISEISFENGKNFKEWYKGKDYTYKIKEVNDKEVKILIYNTKAQDELSLCLYGGKINFTCNIIEYIFLQTVDILNKTLLKK